MKHTRKFTTWEGEDGREHKPLKRMRVFDEDNPRRLFVEVYIWENLWQMRACRHKGASRKRTLGFWHGFEPGERRLKPDKKGRPIISRKLGEMHLCLKQCTYNTIAHEAYHATRTYARRCGNVEAATMQQAQEEKVSDDMPEERNARFLGYLTDRVIAGVYDLIRERADQ